MKEMFIPARFFYAAAKNYTAMNSVCMKVGDYLGALQATARLNQKDIWTEFRNELLVIITKEHEGKTVENAESEENKEDDKLEEQLQQELDEQLLLYLYVAQLNLLTEPQELVMASKLPL